MVSTLYYSLGEDAAARSRVDFDTDSFKLLLVTEAYTPSQSHSRRSDITNEVVGTGYEEGGRPCMVASVSRSGGVTSVTFSNVTWPAPVDGFGARRGIIYKARGGLASADELVTCVDFGTVVTANGTSFTAVLTSPLTITVP